MSDSPDLDLPDVDLDVADRERVIDLFPEAIRASILKDGQLVPHPTGVYLQAIPVDPETGLAAFPYDIAEMLGYYKLDIINNHVYDEVQGEDHQLDLLESDVDWSWFENTEFVMTIVHFGGMVEKNVSMADVVTAYKPQSVEDIAILLAIKLPAKKHLIGQDWDTIRQKIWLKEDSGLPQFKKSHSIGYALLVLIDAKMKGAEWFSFA